MARQFNVDAPRSSFELPALTRQQIQSLMLDLDMDARQVVIAAIAQLWQREIATPDRDLAAEIDALRMRLDAAGIAALPQRADTPSVALGQAPPTGGKELMMDNLVWIVKCDGPRGQAATFAVKRERLSEDGFWQDFLNGATCREFDTEAAATAYENEMQAYYDSVRP